MKRTIALWSIGAILTAFTAFVQLRGVDTGGTGGGGGTVTPTRPGSGQARVVLDLEDLLTLTAALESTHVLLGQPGELALNLGLVTRAGTESGARVPVDLALVLDRSGSMEGDKLLFAKQAAQQLIGLLRPGDRAAFISYASDVTVHTGLLPSSQANVLTGAIWGVTAEGSTNLDGGLSRAVELLSPEARSGRAQRVILISDGEANVGRTTLQDLAPLASGAAERGVSLTTIGVGLSFNEQLMMGLADSGVGNYHYVREGAGLAGAFTTEFDRLARTVVRNAVVEVTPAPGVVIADVVGHTYERNGAGVRVRVGDLFGGMQRKVLVRLRLAPGSAGPTDAAFVRLEVEDPRTSRQLTATAGLGVTVTEQVAEVERGRDPEVAAAVAEVRAAEQMQAAMRQYESGDTAGASNALRGLAGSLSSQGRAIGGAGGARMMQSAERLLSADRAVLAAPSAASEDGRDVARRSRAEARELAH